MDKRIKHRKKIKRLRNANAKIVICDLNKCIKLKAGEILFCEAKDTYTLIYTETTNCIISTKHLAYWQSRLPLFFWRIHRHLLVNSEEIKEFLYKEGKVKLQETFFQIARRRLKEIRKKFRESEER